jgi:adenosine/AMP kinase
MLLKLYNNQKSKLSYTIEEGLNNVVISPYLNLRDLILAQEDFVKTQKDIIQFVSQFAGNNKFGINLGELTASTNTNHIKNDI